MSFETIRSARGAAAIRATGVKAAMAALLALSCVAGFPRPVHADPGGYREHEFREHEFRHEEFHDARYHHDHYYPPHGYRFAVLPPHPRLVVWGPHRYYFSGGVWYEPVNGAYVVIRPPVGVVVPVLPAYYTRVWVGPRLYYYANDVYYLPAPQGYTVVDQPVGTIAMAPPPGTPVPMDNPVTELGPAQGGTQPMPPAVGTAPVASPQTTVAQAGGSQLFIYPRQGQSADQQFRDRNECSSWATSQTGRSPANNGAPMDPDFQRALGACLDGRGYTVK
ncbi:MAG TPA: DUF6515 family protein [Burkholderiales bacterium]|nr:DUF6515 family protein [Burkholderiales bacterium]